MIEMQVLDKGIVEAEVLAGVVNTGGGVEDLDAVLTEQEELVAELKEMLKRKVTPDCEHTTEIWTITYADGTTEEVEVVLA